MDLRLFLFPGAFLATVVVTWGVRSYAIGSNLLDIPNDRSSHSVPTTRGGGIAIVVVTLAALVILNRSGLAQGGPLLAYAGGGLLVAGVGYLDDRSHVSAALRLAVHFGAAISVLIAVGPLPPLPVFRSELDFGLAASAMAAVSIVWLLNLYNFMDGIDGIAAIEAVTVAGGAACLLWYSGVDEVAYLAGVLAATSLGFLVWNWPPARIFMGDVGSVFLGFCFGALMVMTFATDAPLIWIWPILLGTFLVDATVTLFRRVFRRETLYKAHRSHAYQFASRKLGSHRPVTVAVGMINLFWLLPMAFLVTIGRLEGLIALLIAYTPLMGLALYLKAGARELQDV